MAEKKATAPKAPKEQTYTLEQVQAMLERALAEDRAARGDGAPKKETIEVLYAGVMADDSVFNVCDYVNFNHSYDVLTLDKEDFLRHRDNRMDQLLRRKVLVITKGMTDEELLKIGLDYSKDDVLLQDDFRRILDMSAEEIERTFARLCPEHKATVVRVILEAFDKGKKPFTEETIRRLNELSKQAYPRGMFSDLIESGRAR